MILFTYFCFSFAFWGYPLQKYVIRLMIFTVIISTCISLFYRQSEDLAFFLSASVLYFACFSLLMRSLPWSEQIKLMLFSYFICAFTEAFFAQAFRFLQSIGQDNIHFYLEIIAAMLVLALAPLIWLMQMLNWAPGRQLAGFIRNKKTLLLLVLFLLFQLISVYFIIIHSFFNMYISLFISLVIISLSMKLIVQTRSSAVQMTQRVFIDNTNRLFLTMRSQRHDFLNHVQVIHSFVQREKYDELKEYTSTLVDEIQQFNDILSIGHPALCAVVQMKSAIAEQKNILFRFQFTNMENDNLGIKSVDIVKITGNLIDNAFDEVMKLPNSKRWVKIKGWVQENEFHISVENPGKPISKEEKILFFNPGYTTKSAKEGHSGFGLYIVKERVEYYDGEININSSSKSNVFWVRIPVRASG